MGGSQLLYKVVFALMYFFLMFILFSCITTVNDAKIFCFEVFKVICIYISSTVVRDQLIPDILGSSETIVRKKNRTIGFFMNRNATIGRAT
jgi:hypothetical protein